MAGLKIYEGEEMEKEIKKGKSNKTTVAPTAAIPNGFIPIELSTNGLLGVPKIVHCRNFSASDILDLSLFNEAVLPERVISVLNSMILEKTNVSLWPDRVIIELLVKIYVNFFTPILPETNFPWETSDVKWLEERGRVDEAKDLVTGKWVPKIDFDLTWLQIKDLSSEVHSTATFKKPGFSAKFVSYPRYGDVMAIKKVTEQKFQESDKTFEKVKQSYEIRERFIKEGKSLSTLDPISESDFMKWRIHEAKKAIYIAKASQAIYLLELNGEDISSKSIDERITYVERPEFDIQLSKILDKQFEKLEFGIDPKVEVMNPITREKCQRVFSFRLMDILQAIQLSESNEYDISYDEPDSE